MSTSESYMIVITAAFVLMAAVMYLAPKYNRWAARHNSKRKHKH